MASRFIRPAGTGKLSSICLALLLTVGLATQQTAAALDAQEVARSFYGVLLSTMRDGRALGQSGRYTRLTPVVDRTFDIAAMTRLAVGPQWGTLSPPQQQRLIA